MTQEHGALGSVWKHKKRGTSYRIQDYKVRAQCETPLQDGEYVMLYYNIEDGTYSVRRAAEFHDGRFEKVNAQLEFYASCLAALFVDQEIGL